MPIAWRTCWPRCRDLAVAATLALLLAMLVGCGDDRDAINKLLDDRADALNALDVDAYVKLIAPDYVKASPDFDARRQMNELFGKLASVEYVPVSRDIEFREPGLARIVQEYRMTLVNHEGQSRKIKGYDHFLVRRYGSGPFAKWLIYQGLDAPAKPAEPAPAAPAPDAGAPPAEGDKP